MPPDRAGELLAQARRQFEDRGLATPALDARLLLQHAAGLAHEDIIADPWQTIGAEALRAFQSFVARRVTGEPVSRITGQREFYGRDFLISPATLDPRPDTETLIEAALDLIPQDEERRVLDLGTGSGAIAVTLLAERPHASAVASDISSAALDAARENARRLGVSGRCSFAAGSWFDGVSGRFDLIVSNPPYIARAILDTLAAEVKDFDPAAALDGGADGLAAYREIAAKGQDFLAPGGRILVEIGVGQATEIERIFINSGLELSGRRHDLAGHVRCLAFKAR